eukprot:COSAG02_NODE_11191_length_1773_cov_6.173238_1_plen_69_part_10
MFHRQFSSNKPRSVIWPHTQRAKRPRKLLAQRSVLQLAAAWAPLLGSHDTLQRPAALSSAAAARAPRSE